MVARIFITAAISILFNYQTAHAATWYVDCEGCSEGADGLSWETALCSVQDAIDLASPGDEIWVLDGICTEGVTLTEGLSLYGGFLGDEATAEDRDTESNRTVLDASTLFPRRTTVIVNGLTSAHVDGFVLSGGSGENNRFTSGGNVWIYQSGPDVEVSNCTMRGGTARAGGGLDIYEASATVRDCTFVDNYAPEGGGGLNHFNSTTIVADCVFVENSTDVFGGGIAARSGSISVMNCIFEENTAREGGGLHGFRCSGVVTGSVFRANECSVIGGGVGWYDDPLVVSSCLFFGNTAVDRGGALECHESNQCDIINSVFAGNHADSGGGALNFDAQVASVINSTFSGNSSSSGGGTIQIQRATTAIINSIFEGSSDYGIYEDNGSASATLESNLFFNNPSGYYRDIEGAVLNTIAALNNFPNSDNNIEGSPSFVNPGTDNYRIGFDSAARGMASASFAPFFDFEGDERPGPGGTVDIGADEITDMTPPTVLEITTDAPELTNADELIYNVEFDEFVDGVSTDDFEAIVTGLSGVSISAVVAQNKAASMYQVRVNTGTGNGTVKLSLIDDDSIIDLAGIPLGGEGAGNGDFTGEQTIMIDRSPPEITLNDPNPLTVEAGATTLTFDVSATDNTDGDLTAQVVSESNPPLDLSTPGSYAITFRVTDAAGNETVSEVLTVVVADTTPPLLALLGDNPLTLGIGDNYTEPGAVAIDSIDGDLTDDVTTSGTVDTTTPGTSTITYSVSDAAGNIATTNRVVIVKDAVPPTITLLGDNPMDVGVGESFTDPGATASDAFDGDLTAEIETEGSVDTGTTGSYTILYRVTDSSGNTATAVRVVNVLTAPDFTLLPEAQSVASDAGEVTFNLFNTGDTDQSWSASVISGGEWATLTGGATGENEGVITVAVAENTALEARTATIRIVSTSKAALPLEATVTQAAAPKTGLFGCGPSGGQAPGGMRGDWAVVLLLVTTVLFAGRRRRA